MNRLLKHKIIGLDLDETLIDHKISGFLSYFVKKHHKEKDFWIVTFRSNSYADETQVFNDLLDYGITREHIKGIRFIPDEIFNASLTDTNHKEFNEWKGKICSELGCTIFVDDRPNWVQAGCEKVGVEFVNTHTLKKH